VLVRKNLALRAWPDGFTRCEDYDKIEADLTELRTQKNSLPSGLRRYSEALGTVEIFFHPERRFLPWKEQSSKGVKVDFYGTGKARPDQILDFGTQVPLLSKI
jgi:hypothetical protein